MQHLDLPSPKSFLPLIHIPHLMKTTPCCPVMGICCVPQLGWSIKKKKKWEALTEEQSSSSLACSTQSCMLCFLTAFLSIFIFRHSPLHALWANHTSRDELSSQTCFFILLFLYAIPFTQNILLLLTSWLFSIWPWRNHQELQLQLQPIPGPKALLLQLDVWKGYKLLDSPLLSCSSFKWPHVS